MKDDPIINEIKRRHSDIPQDGLFEIQPMTSNEERNKKTSRAKTVRTIKCPDCMNRKVGVFNMRNDLGQWVEIIRDHDRVTRKGHRFPCPASGRAI